MLPNLNPMELLVVLGVAVLLFGKRLPEVGRSLGRGIVEFKKGFRGVETEFRSFTDLARLDHTPSTAGHSPVSTLSYPDRAATAEPTAPKFEPPAGTTVPVMEYEP